MTRIGYYRMRFLLFFLLTTPVWAAPPLTLVVMDPLAAPLSCPCVEGYAQRDYTVLAKSLSQKLGCEVVVGFGDSLKRGQQQAGNLPADIVIGKDSVVRADATKLGVQVTPLARLTGKEGKTTQHGLVVVRSDSPATDVASLAGYQVFFGPGDSNEKHAAALRLLAQSGVRVPVPEGEAISAACSDGACRVVELGPKGRAAAVISSYAEPLLEGCGTIQPGDLRIVGRTAPVPFITAFATDRVDAPLAAQVTDALIGLLTEPETLRALESLIGFTRINDAYHREVEAAGRLPKEEVEVPSAEWPGWGGPTRDGIAAWLPDRLPESPRFVWRQSLRREGLGGVAVAEGCVVIGDRNLTNDFDLWRCYNSATGEPLWQRRYPASGHLDYDNAPRATPLIADGRAYLQGAFGHLTCVRLDTGKPVWRRDLRAEYGADYELIWGLCASPLLVEGLLIVSPGARDASWVALDAKSGKERWRTPGDQHAFASPIVATLGGVRQLIAYDRSSLGGWNPETGQRLWTFQPPREGDFNVSTPVVLGEHLLALSENNGARRYRFTDRGQIDPMPVAVYEHLAPDTSTPVVLGDQVFCLWEDLYCLDTSDGKLVERWVGADTAFPQAGALIAGRTRAGAGRLLVIGRSGELLLLDPNADPMKILSRSNLFGVAPKEASDLLTLPALVGERLYLRSEEELVCVRLSVP